MTPIVRLTPEQLCERYPQLHPAQRRFFARREEMVERCTHIGPVPMPNRAERRRMAALKRRAKR